MNNKLNQWIAIIDDTDKEEIEMAKRMLEKGKDTEEIIELTELTKEEIESLR